MTSPTPLSKANTSFSLALFRELSDNDRTANVFYSPFSISSALAMVLLGAGGNTAAEMSKVRRRASTATAGGHARFGWKQVKGWGVFLCWRHTSGRHDCVWQRPGCLRAGWGVVTCIFLTKVCAPHTLFQFIQISVQFRSWPGQIPHRTDSKRRGKSSCVNGFIETWFSSSCLTNPAGVRWSTMT